MLPEVDGQREDTVDHRRGRVTDDGEIHEVVLRLLDERGAFVSRDGRKRAIANGIRPVPEPLEHRVEIDFVGHGPER